MVNFKDELAAYAAKLQEDLDSDKPRVFAPVVWAYQNAKVRNAIAARLEAGEVLISSAQIVPDRALRKERVYFDFASRGLMEDRQPGILVQINDDNSVAEIMDPFDLDIVSYKPLRTTRLDTLPLFAAQASMLSQGKADQDAAEALKKRFVEFMEFAGFGRYFFPSWGGLFGGIFGDNPGTLSGGTPTLSAVVSSPGDKEDPDQDTSGSYYDDA